LPPAEAPPHLIAGSFFVAGQRFAVLAGGSVETARFYKPTV
jgi:hypothetical protein